MKKVAFFSILVLIALISCRKEATRWNSNWSAPIINDSLTLKNWINDSTLNANGSGYLDVDLKRQLFHFDLNSIVGIPDTTLQNNFSLAASLTVPPGYSFVNQSEEKDLYLDPIELTKINLKKGQISVLLKNPYPTKVICTISLPGVTKNGQTISEELEVAAGSLSNPTSGTKIIDLAGSQMDLTGTSGGGKNKLVYQITVKSDPNGPSVQTTSSYVTQVYSTIQNIQLEYAKGYFGHQIISDTVETDVAILQKWIDGDITLPGLNLDLTLSNGIKAMARINLKELITTKSNGLSTSLYSSQINVPQNVNSAAGSWNTLSPSQTVYSFQTGNSNIKDFLEHAGPKIKLVYDFELNPLGNISGSWNEIFPNSSVDMNLRLTMPLGLTLNNFTLADTFALDLNSAKKQLAQARSAEIAIELANGFPIEGKLMLKFLGQDKEILVALTDYQFIESGLMGSVNSDGIAVKNSKIAWQFSQADFEKLTSCKFISLISVFDTPDPATSLNSSVLLQENSFLGCKMIINLQYESKYE
ncbi:MAG: hypothetical protein WC044_03710 [Crocinitomicaceae bacterium]